MVGEDNALRLDRGSVGCGDLVSVCGTEIQILTTDQRDRLGTKRASQYTGSTSILETVFR